MKLDSLKKLYLDELKDLYSAENQILKALPKMIKKAMHPQLKKAFVAHEKQTQEHARRLERICKALGEKPGGKKCLGMEGVIADGAELMKEKAEPEVMDAGLIAAAQHVEHYEMAGYGTVRTYAKQLGFTDHQELLQRTLDEEQATDLLLTQLAESSINIEAEEPEGEGSGAGKKAPAKRR